MIKGVNKYVIEVSETGNVYYDKVTTLPLTVYNFKGRYFSEWNLIFADLLLVALPMVILYVICQKYIVSGVTAGAVKQ